MNIARQRMLMATLLLVFVSTRVHDLRAFQDANPLDSAEVAEYPLSVIALNLGDADTTAAQWIASQQASPGGAPVYTNAKMNSRASFSGSFTPASKTTKLAIFSDDGCDVFVNGRRVDAHLKMGQHLPNLRESFHTIPFRANPGETYSIRVEYCNMLYAPGWDMDGATLFAFEGGGTFSDTTDKPAK
jgi:hypothetical protein